MNREDARKQFDAKTEEFGIKHTFPFDEAWDFVEYKRDQTKMVSPRMFLPANYTKEEFREGITKLEQRVKDHKHGCKTQEEVNKFNPLRHSFGDGCYVREIFNPKGSLLVTKIHKVAHPFFLMKGKMSILSEEGETLLEAPHYGITKPGTKRIIFTHEDCVFVTVHVTNETDLTKIEEQIIAKDFAEIEEVDVCHG